MATENVTQNPGKPGAFYLPSKHVDQAEILCAQGRALASCIGVTVHSGDPVPDDTILNACWLMDDLLDRIEKITALRRPATEAETA